jgi:hypothetical protein
MRVKLSDLRSLVREALGSKSLDAVVSDQPDSLVRIAKILNSGAMSGDLTVNVTHSAITIYPEGVMGASLVLSKDGTWSWKR